MVRLAGSRHPVNDVPLRRRGGATPRGGHMSPDGVTAQYQIAATCIEEGERRLFKMKDSEPDEAVAVYSCVECGHDIRLDLNP